MEVLNERAAFLSNCEVRSQRTDTSDSTQLIMSFLLQVYAVLKEVKSPKANVATIVYEVNRTAVLRLCMHNVECLLILTLCVFRGGSVLHSTLH